MSTVKNINNKAKRKFRKVLAVLLSIVLAAGLALTYSSDSVLRAEELSPDEVKTEIEETKKEEQKEAKQEEQKKEQAPAPAPAPQKQESKDSGNTGSSANTGNSGNTENQGSGQDSGSSDSSQAQETPAPETNDQGQSGTTDSGAKVAEDEISLDSNESGTEEADEEEENWIVTFYDRDAQVYKKVKVKKGDAIGDKIPSAIPREDYYTYWAVGQIVAGGQGNETKVTGKRINGSFKPSSEFST